MWSRTLPLVLAGSLPAVAASGARPPLSFQHDPIEYYGARFLVGMLAFAILLIVYSLVRYRGRVESPVSWGLLVAGVGVLPGASILFGSLLVFHRAEGVAFCASCHLAMKPYVDDMQNPASQSLAAVHYKNRYIPSDQCYTCHTSFGMFGDVQAKWAGMIDVQRYYMRSFEFPLTMRAPYPNTDCLKCHAEAMKWSAAHKEFKESVFDGEVSCLECHGKAHSAIPSPG